MSGVPYVVSVSKGLWAAVMLERAKTQAQVYCVVKQALTERRLERAVGVCAKVVQWRGDPAGSLQRTSPWHEWQSCPWLR